MASALHAVRSAASRPSRGATLPERSPLVVVAGSRVIVVGGLPIDGVAPLPVRGPFIDGGRVSALVACFVVLLLSLAEIIPAHLIAGAVPERVFIIVSRHVLTS